MQEDLAAVVTVPALTPEQKELRKLAKRIIKAVQGHLEGAVRQEAELGGKPFEKELRELDLLLDNGIFSRRESTVASVGDDPSDMEATEGKRLQTQLIQSSSLPNGEVLTENSLEGSGTQGPSIAVVQQQSVAINGAADLTQDTQQDQNADSQRSPPQPTTASAAALTDGITETQELAELTRNESVGGGVNGIQTTVRETQETATNKIHHQSGPPTPPLSSSEDLLAPLTHGGIPWYMEPFDPVGTTIHEERWTGREVVRGMSEELSELDEEELRGLVDEEMVAGHLQPKEPTPPPPLPAQPAKRLQPRGEKGRFKSMKNVKKK